MEIIICEFVDNEGDLTNCDPYCKYPIPLILSLIVSVGLTTFTFVGLILILGGIFLITFD